MVTFREVLQELLGLPGATYSCVADRAAGRLLEEVGTSSVAPGAVMELGGSAAGFLAFVAGDGLDDLMITSLRSYHLVRPVLGDPRQQLMIYLCLDRGRSNLAAARRELAASSLHKRLASATVGPPGGTARTGVAGTMPTPRQAPPHTSPQTPSPGMMLLSANPSPRPTAPVATPARPVPAPPGPARSSGPVEPPPVRPVLHRAIPTVLPLPRRSGPSRVPPPLPTEPAAAVHPVTGQSWATDVGTMRRLLTALRSLH